MNNNLYHTDKHQQKTIETNICIWKAFPGVCAHILVPIQRTHCLYVWSVEKRNHLKQYVCSVQMMQWWQVLEPDPNEERGVRWVCGCFHKVLCGFGWFQGQPELPRGVSWST